MTFKLPKLIATSVVRGSVQGESHGGIYTVDFDKKEAEQHVDWNTSNIDFEGRGADRGLRGICFNEEDIYIAASDELFCYDKDFKLKNSFKNRYLKHAHEICRMEKRIFISSTGFDSLLSFDIESKKFDWGYQLRKEFDQWAGGIFDPRKPVGPRPVNDFHINMVHVDNDGIFLSGLKTESLLYLSPKNTVEVVCELPSGTHNPRLWGNGIIFNDTASDCLRYVPRNGEEIAFKVITYKESEIEFAGIDASKIARQGFARGLCTIDDRFLAVGSSPSTISLYDLKQKQMVGSVNLSMDIRNAIHGLEVWPFD